MILLRVIDEWNERTAAALLGVGWDATAALAMMQLVGD
jgi:hypothetical protein